MFRTTLVRSARLARAPASRALLAGLRPALRTATPLQAAPSGRIAPLMSILSASRRAYSTESAASAEAATETAENTDGLITRFADLESLGVHENLVQSLTDGMGYKEMTPVQSMTIKPALAGKDMVAQARTGTGKTLAFLIPTFQNMISANPDLAYRRRVRARSDDILAIVISPTRELAEQISAEARKLCKDTSIIVQTAVGGTQRREMLHRTRREGCHLLVATPGRLNDLLSDPQSGIDAPRLTSLVLDEADRMLDVGFDKELSEIVHNLPSRKEQPRQTLLFSATIPKNVIGLARTYVDPTNFEFVQTIDPNEAPTHEKVPQHIIPVRGYENFYPTMLELFKREIAASSEPGSDAMPFKAIVFLPTTSFVQLTTMTFQNLGREDRSLPRQYHIHSKLTQQQRTKAAEFFRNAKSAILFSSDVTARGMDFPNVSHVVQVGLPPDREQYIHRLGRTGRADKGGEGWLIIPEDEVNLARNMLHDLPIKRVRGLPSAEHDLSRSEGAPESVEKINAAMQRVPKGLLEDTYMTFFGGSTKGRSLQVVADNLNNWVRNVWGWEEPPAISYSSAQRRGMLNIRGLNIQRTPRRNDDRYDDRSAGRSGDRFSSRGSDDKGSTDSFDEFEGMFNSNNNRSRNRSSGDRSFGNRSSGNPQFNSGNRDSGNKWDRRGRQSRSNY